MTRFEFPSFEHPWLQAFATQLSTRSKAIGKAGRCLASTEQEPDIERMSLTLFPPYNPYLVFTASAMPEVLDVDLSLAIRSERKRDRDKVLLRLREVVAGPDPLEVASLLEWVVGRKSLRDPQVLQETRRAWLELFL